MNRNHKATAIKCGLAAGALLLSNGILAEAAPVAGATAVTTAKEDVVVAKRTTPVAGATALASADAQTVEKHSYSTVAGANRVMADLIATADELVAEREAAQKDELLADLKDIENIAIANVNEYVNVRKAPDQNSEAVGKLYANNYAKIQKVKGDWYKVTSGNVTGYVRGDYLKVGNKKAVMSAGRTIARVNAESLYVRSSASKKSDVIAMVPSGDALTVVDASKKDDGWVKVAVRDGEGYVAADYVDVARIYSYGETLAEETARLNAERELIEEIQSGEATVNDIQNFVTTEPNSVTTSPQISAVVTQIQEQPQTQPTVTPSGGQSTESAASGTYSTPSGSGGASVVSYASQFVGNPYVYGGTSLTNGCDCSGFVQSVYAHYGVSLPHNSDADMSVGYGVSQSDMQPGDIVVYSGHVGIYAGNGQIVNAANSRDGIRYSNANYSQILAVRRIF